MIDLLAEKKRIEEALVQLSRQAALLQLTLLGIETQLARKEPPANG